MAGLISYLHEHCEGIAELRAIPVDRTGGLRATPLFTKDNGTYARFLKRYGGSDSKYGIFFGVCTRIDGDAHKGGAAFCQHAPAAWIDIDNENITHVLQVLRSIPFPPSAVVCSGHGVHAYWRFNEPLDCQNPDDMRKLVALNQRLAGVLGGDHKATDVARVLRVPNTWNTKYAESIKVELLDGFERKDYEPDDLLEWISMIEEPLLEGPAPIVVVDEEARDDPFTAYAQNIALGERKIDVEEIKKNIAPGNIHWSQVKLLATFLSRGYSLGDAIEAVLEATKPAAAMWEEKHGRRWNWDLEEKKLLRDGKHFIKKIMGEAKYEARRAAREAADNPQANNPHVDNTQPEPDPESKPKGIEDWKQALQCNTNGGYLDNETNSELYIKNGVGLAGRLRYNALTATIELKDDEDVWRAWRDDDSSRYLIRAQMNGHPKMTLSKFNNALPLAAREMETIDPLADYLGGLSWDGESRLRSLLIDHAGAADSDYTREVTLRWFISAIARALDPGCQADHVLVLEGKQGARKTTFAREIARSNELFAENLPHDLKAQQEIIRGKWIVEVSEMVAFTKKEIGDLKAFISAREDDYRVPYARHASKYRRRSVFLGTINPSHEGYLRDPTGGRRFWIVPVDDIDIAAVREVIDQVWAEAVFLYEQGERWWIEEAEMVDELEAVQRSRQSYMADELFEIYRTYLQYLPEKDTETGKPADPGKWKDPRPDGHLMEIHLGSLMEYVPNGENHVVKSFMRKILKGQGWEFENKARRRKIDRDFNASRVNLWIRPGGLLPEESVDVEKDLFDATPGESWSVHDSGGNLHDSGGGDEAPEDFE